MPDGWTVPVVPLSPWPEGETRVNCPERQTASPGVQAIWYGHAAFTVCEPVHVAVGTQDFLFFLSSNIFSVRMHNSGACQQARPITTVNSQPFVNVLLSFTENPAGRHV
jgi:hypothetical protein